MSVRRNIHSLTSIFSSDEMSNKVLSVDRRFVSRPSDGTTGNPESLKGKINVKDMGSRVTRSKAPEDIKDAKLKSAVSSSSDRKPKKVDTGYSLLTSSNDVDGITYFPQTPETRQIFDLIMSEVLSLLEDVSHEVIRSAADSILSTLKDDSLKDFDKKREIEGILGLKISNEKYNQFNNLSRRITDYESSDAQNEDKDNKVDDELGVAVTFEGSDDEGIQEDSEDEQGYDSDSSSPDIKTGDDEYQSLANNEDLEVIESGKTSEEKKNDEIPAHEIDAFWLQRQIANLYSESDEIQEKTSTIFEILASDVSLGQAENDIMEVFDFDHNELVQLLCKNRSKIVWLTRLARADTELEKESVRLEMKNSGYSSYIDELYGKPVNAKSNEPSADVDMEDAPEEIVRTNGLRAPQIVDLDSLVFEQGSHLNTVGKISLPNGTTKSETKTYEEYNVPPPIPSPQDQPLVPISDLPSWAHAAFGGVKSLNRVQSKVFPSAFNSSENILLCAPTGAGKTNVALLTILETISHYLDLETNKIDLDAFKIVYISPLKALVQEQVREFGEKLEPFGIKVSELTGDRNLTKQQISETQMIITTPEKWDVITRKSSDTSYTNLVRLIIIDEIHLLHDERGPVLESIVARTIRHEIATRDPVRLVGLSATLPNYRDVARFLRVDTKKGLFFFDSTYRPCPLAQCFIGITEKKAIKRYQAMNDACYDKVMQYAGQHQVIIFVHSRKETAKTARYLRDKAAEEGTLNKFLRSDIKASELLKAESESVKSTDLKDLLPTGFAIHHAGLSRADRASSEEMFRTGCAQVLVSTATLAWGVNLPAHTVIIKGTQVYSPEKGRWTELSPQDVLQMLGRAGRPKYDKSGDGVIITAHSELNYYMSLINASLPIESQLMSKLVDNINAEISLGTIRTRDDAIEWLGYTYLYVRMLKSPRVYRVGADYDEDPTLTLKRLDLSHTALSILRDNNLIKYDAASGRVQPTDLGRIASNFYISHTSMTTYNTNLKPFLTPIEIFRIFSLSEEFRFIPVRQEEKLELAKLLEKAPIPIKESVEEPAAKINILLQAYISRLKLDGFALMADMVYITQSAGRLFRAIYEISLRKGWASLTRTTLEICKMVEKRLWFSNSPFRQFPNCPIEVIKKTEASQLPWSKYFDLTDAAEVGQVIRVEKAGGLVFELLQEFPRLSLDAHYQPITPSLLKIELVITAEFTRWNRSLHGNAETFLLLVEDGDGETILYSDSFVLREQYLNDEHIVEFTVPISVPTPPNYFISLISEKWLHSETRVALSLKNLIIPEKFPAPTNLLDRQPIPVSSLDNEEYASIFPWETFNRIQTQTFHTLYNTDDNVFIGASVGNGKTVCAEIALLRHWNDEDHGKAIYIAPFQDQVDDRLADWTKRLSKLQGGKVINKFTGELSADIKLLNTSDLILATPTQWDSVSRNWLKRRAVQNVSFAILDDIHMLGGMNGFVYEVIASRLRLAALELENPLRIVALSVSLSNAKDLGQWLYVSSSSVFNFLPKERQLPLEVHLQSFNIPHHPSLMIAMAHPTYHAIRNLSEGQASLVYVNDRKQCISTSQDLVRLSYADHKEDIFRLIDLEHLNPALERIKDNSLRESLENGIGFIYPHMEKSDRTIVERLFNKGAIQVILATRDTCWSAGPLAKLVVIMGTQIYEGQEHRYVDYPISELLQMMGHANRLQEDSSSKVLVLTNTAKREYYKKFLNEALPIESHLNLSLRDAFVTEISVEIINSKSGCIDWLTYSYFYRRLSANPSFYGLTDTTPQGISEYLSELIENTLEELVEANMIEIEENDEGDVITPLNGAIIASYHNISFVSLQTFILSLNERTRLKSLLEIVTSAEEFESSLPIRTHEDLLLRKIYNHCPVKSNDVNFNSVRFKAFVLLQAHLSRMTLPPDLVADQQIVLEKILSLLAGCVDVFAGEGYLNATYAMDLSQMVVQAMWNKDSPLKQIPYFTSDIIANCKAEGVSTVAEFLEVVSDEDESKRARLLNGMSDDDPRMVKIANFVNKYPNIEQVSYELEDEDDLHVDEPSVIRIKIEREVDEDEEPDLDVESQYYPFHKRENWWVVFGEAASNKLYGIKRVSLGKAVQEVALPFTIPDAGVHDVAVWVMCDSYYDVDREIDFKVTVGEKREVAEEEDVEMED